MTLIGLTMSIGEGHRSAARVEFDLGPGPEVRAQLGPILEVGPGIEQELEVKVVTALTPGMSIPTPQPMARNPQIGE